MSFIFNNGPQEKLIKHHRIAYNNHISICASGLKNKGATRSTNKWDSDTFYIQSLKIQSYLPWPIERLFFASYSNERVSSARVKLNINLEY